ncbi:MAG: right-handed parallel beta-helix repeat-containing protein, partial [Pseudomonadota bacterium]
MGSGDRKTSEQPSHRFVSNHSLRMNRFVFSVLVRPTRVLFVVLMVMVFTCNLSVADTSVSGIISVDTTWTLDKSPYIVTSTITVTGTDGEDGVTTLTIEPGVTLLFNTYCGLTIGGQTGDPGALSALGTLEAPVRFTSLDSWYGLKFLNTTEDTLTVLNHCEITNTRGVYLSSVLYGAVVITDASPVIKNSIIKNNARTGIVINGASSPQLLSNTIASNGNYGIYSYSTQQHTISGNELTGNGDYDIYFVNSNNNPIVNGNTFNNGIFLPIGYLPDTASNTNTINYNSSYPLSFAPDCVSGVVNHWTINNTDSNSVLKVMGGTLTMDGSWNNKLSYNITGNITIQGTDGEDGITTLNVESGATLRFNTNCTLTIGGQTGDPGA